MPDYLLSQVVRRFKLSAALLDGKFPCAGYGYQYVVVWIGNYRS
jgi:hypothetical protein